MRKKRRENMELTALAVEAKRQGMSYGQLVAATTAREQQKIIRAYMGGPAEPRMERVPTREGENLCQAHADTRKDPTAARSGTRKAKGR